MSTDNILFSHLENPLGPMIAGATDNGVCFLEWHDRGGLERIMERVTKRYRRSLAEGTNRHLAQLEQEMLEYFIGKRRQFAIAIDVTGTEFEQNTWSQLLKIPYGETRSYSQIGMALGKPKARRAVGRANGANYLAIVIPCHRVIEANGNLRGYGGGVWRKKWLLELEQTGSIPPVTTGSI